MTFEQFAAVFATVAVQLRAQDADEATARAYFAALQDLDLELLAMAATRLARQASWFPKTSEWRETAAAIEGERQAELRKRLRERASQGLPPLCEACRDTAWEHDADGRVRPCDCREQRRLELLGRRPWPALPDRSRVRRRRRRADRAG